MTRWRPIAFDAALARAQLQEFRLLLRGHATISEADVCAFVRAREQLVAAIGLLNSSVDTVNRWAPEVDLGGKHSCDLAVGDSRRTAYTLVEFEDAGPDSVFKSQPATPYWTDRFNHGYAQIIDWLCFLDGTQMTPQFRDYWGAATPPQFVGVLVIGRAVPALEGEGRQRIEWRSAKVKVNSYPVLCMTYHDLVDRLLNKLDMRAGLDQHEVEGLAPPPEGAP
jgi:hypothetical protein